MTSKGLIYSGMNMNELASGFWFRYSGEYNIENKPPYESFIVIVYNTASYKIQIAYNVANIKESVRRAFFADVWGAWEKQLS